MALDTIASGVTVVLLANNKEQVVVSDADGLALFEADHVGTATVTVNDSRFVPVSQEIKFSGSNYTLHITPYLAIQLRFVDDQNLSVWLEQRGAIIDVGLAERGRFATFISE